MTLRDEFERDGAVVLRDVLSDDWIDLLRRGVARNLQAPGPGACRYTPSDGPGGFYDDYCNWQRIPEYEQFVVASPCARLAASVLGVDALRFYHEHILVKEPGTLERTPWHHDLPYYGIVGRHLVSLW